MRLGRQHLIGEQLCLLAHEFRGLLLAVGRALEPLEEGLHLDPQFRLHRAGATGLSKEPAALYVNPATSPC